MTRIQVNALGQPTPGGQLVSEPPTPGDNLKLTIDPEVQEAGEAALAERGLPGAFVSMNIHTGEILGIGSFPTYDPTVFTQPMTQARYNELYPRPDRGAALQPGDRRRLPDRLDLQDHHRAGGARKRRDHAARTSIFDNGYIELAGQKFQNAGGAIYGPIDPGARRCKSPPTSSSTSSARGCGTTNYLQQWSHKLGIGDPTGIDLPAAKPKAWCRARNGATSSSRKAKPNAPGRPATTSSWRPARATCRPTRCRWRSPTRRSATAARSSPRTWARKSRTPPAGC